MLAELIFKCRKCGELTSRTLDAHIEKADILQKMNIDFIDCYCSSLKCSNGVQSQTIGELVKINIIKY